ncbi:hypothetical protein NEF87_000368 [Candidatus Lokiarchaeum ossiferum]|uniref:MIP18 family-like domain-containing protein n=1 Tax=Candidatus Lokiarchaeum ossiferum TaxID=2951803 RepID=A0ABY6HKP5_9ARCH|nr:hypothetical protein NEF87_000368 [Candidatus Lokiarchaeum sp. B-35]
MNYVNISGLEVMDILKSKMHPILKYSLIDMGMIRDIIVEGKEVSLTIVWPTADFPNKDEIHQSILNSIENLGAKVSIGEILMSKEELTLYRKIEAGDIS